MIRVEERTASIASVVHKNLDDFLNQQTFTWNCALEERIGAWEKKRDIITAIDQCKSLTQIRKDDEWFAKYHAHSQKSIFWRQDKAFKNLRRRKNNGEKGGYPRFKGADRKVRSFESGTLSITRSGYKYYVNIKGIGKFHFRKKVEGEVKLIRVVKTAQRIKLQFIVELPDQVILDDRAPVGIDVGVTNRISLSTGEQIPKREVSRKKLEKLQRKVSRSESKSKSMKKKVKLLAKEHQRVAERNRGQLHEITADLIKNHSARFYLENLDINNMTAKGGNRKKGINRAMRDQTWGIFANLLSYKAESAGGFVQKVDPRNTSQACSACGLMPEEKVKWGQTIYHCVHCGFKEDRDLNAASNILHTGLTGIPAGTAGARGEGRSTASVGALTAQNSIGSCSQERLSI